MRKEGLLLPSVEESTSVMASFAREDAFPATGSIRAALAICWSGSGQHGESRSLIHDAARGEDEGMEGIHNLAFTDGCVGQVLQLRHLVDHLV